MANVYHRCRQCRRTEEEAGRISRRGLCGDCATANYQENLRQQATQAGPLYERGRRNWAKAGGNAGRPITPY